MDTQKVNYYNEISLMMFGFGDSHTPNPDTVRLVENIVLSQLRLIVRKALEYSRDKVRGEELVFLMRRNKAKMQRFVKYLRNKDSKRRLESEDVVDLTGKTKHPLLTFIEKIDEFGEFMDTNDSDEIIRRRRIRADRISLALDERRYVEFSRARCASFNSSAMSPARNFDKLRRWIDPKREIDFAKSSFDILAYYAYETVAQLADCAFAVRLDGRRTVGDPLDGISGMYYTGSMFNGEHRFPGPSPDYSRVYNGQPPFSVGEITEVMRRLSSGMAGKLNFDGRLAESHCIIAI